MRKNFALTAVATAVLGLTQAAFAGSDSSSGKEMKQVAPPPCPEWYSDN